MSYQPMDEPYSAGEALFGGSTTCYCTLDEYLDGHRCRCPEHKPCWECIDEEEVEEE